MSKRDLLNIVRFRRFGPRTQTRVGSAQDLVAGGYTTTQIARVGGRSTEAVVNHYPRDLLTTDTAIPVLVFDLFMPLGTAQRAAVA